MMSIYIKGSKYLFIDKGIVNKKNKIIYKPNNKKFTYSVPITIESSEDGGLIKIRIATKNSIYNYDELYRVNYMLLKSYTLEVWNKLLNKITNN